ncbi:DUF1488 family protein [Sedimenticola selenatireducens]|jgi:hypothetical protein|uniref:DUF1488 domain-containing protein n=1 Tax=Sedimenticola selenatireducens TaxID=191960 RepID=A0A558DW98_9GAMM|nr:DUF1488 family protein [Sedimenticola selenatireducens]TVO77873.1 DUF1488 domain-containing protein [Sedimenticola selenatireducens]TVT65178.1 MAG: DUF1488 domain-containing protein [Sedimenticola selenatireducens]
MQLTRHGSAASGSTKVSFPRLECWNATAKVATVAAEVDKKRILCRISLDILIDKFGATREDPMQSVAQHRMAIQEAASRLIESNTYEEDGSVLIRSTDL